MYVRVCSFPPVPVYVCVSMCKNVVMAMIVIAYSLHYISKLCVCVCVCVCCVCVLCRLCTGKG